MEKQKGKHTYQRERNDRGRSFAGGDEVIRERESWLWENWK